MAFRSQIHSSNSDKKIFIVFFWEMIKMIVNLRTILKVHWSMTLRAMIGCYFYRSRTLACTS